MRIATIVIFVAGAAPLARDGSRFSKDIDVFHDRCRATALRDQRNVITTGARRVGIVQYHDRNPSSQL